MLSAVVIGALRVNDVVITHILMTGLIQVDDKHIAPDKVHFYVPATKWFYPLSYIHVSVRTSHFTVLFVSLQLLLQFSR